VRVKIIENEGVVDMILCYERYESSKIGLIDTFFVLDEVEIIEKGGPWPGAENRQF
jgi:hypothetical protein